MQERIDTSQIQDELKAFFERMTRPDEFAAKTRERQDLIYNLSLLGIPVPKSLVKPAINHYLPQALKQGESVSPEEYGINQAIVIAINQGRPGTGVKYALITGKYDFAIEQLNKAGLKDYARAVATIASEITEQGENSRANAKGRYAEAARYAKMGGEALEDRVTMLEMLHHATTTK